jgi:hypothetical protein
MIQYLTKSNFNNFKINKKNFLYFEKMSFVHLAKKMLAKMSIKAVLRKQDAIVFFFSQNTKHKFFYGGL